MNVQFNSVSNVSVLILIFITSASLKVNLIIEKCGKNGVDLFKLYFNTDQKGVQNLCKTTEIGYPGIGLNPELFCTK
jgi:hypothetical protein